jgi:hypothetical protein
MLWTQWPMQVLLYGGFAVHYALALWACGNAVFLRLRPAEWAQLVLGFAIPLRCFEHASTFASRPIFGVSLDDYSFVCGSTVRRPGSAWSATVLVPPGAMR